MVQHQVISKLNFDVNLKLFLAKVAAWVKKVSFLYLQHLLSTLQQWNWPLSLYVDMVQGCVV